MVKRVHGRVVNDFAVAAVLENIYIKDTKSKIAPLVFSRSRERRMNIEFLARLQGAKLCARAETFLLPDFFRSGVFPCGGEHEVNERVNAGGTARRNRASDGRCCCGCD